MTHRQRFFAVLEGRPVDRPPFFPDISDWYVAGRTPPGEDRRFGCGAFIPDADPIHEYPGSIPDEFAGMTYLDFYRRFDWGLPVHTGAWYEVQYDGVERTVRREGRRRITTLRCPAGVLQSVDAQAEDGSWCPTEHFAKSLEDLEVVRYVVEHTRFVPRFDRLEKEMAGIGEQGMCDLVLPRSPFGKLVHWYLGFEQVVYALHDDPQAVVDYLDFQAEHDLELVRLAAQAPARVVIMSDHTDENLIAPPYYRRYCIPYYRRVSEVLHAAGKILSTHLDGNIRGYLKDLPEAGFDLLDGCTPAPMTNYEVEELAEALPANIRCFCGVPATLLVQGLDDEVILDFGRRILDAFAGRVILNVGDILPPNGNIHQVIKLGEMAREYAL